MTNKMRLLVLRTVFVVFITVFLYSQTEGIKVLPPVFNDSNKAVIKLIEQKQEPSNNLKELEDTDIENLQKLNVCAVIANGCLTAEQYRENREEKNVVCTIKDAWQSPSTLTTETFITEDIDRPEKSVDTEESVLDKVGGKLNCLITILEFKQQYVCGIKKVEEGTYEAVVLDLSELSKIRTVQELKGVAAKECNSPTAYVFHIE